jgi:aminocarboxymuconate-semialdehyde decarboxylase
MPTRRTFFRAAAGAAAAMYVSRYAAVSASAQSTASRREATIGGRRVRVVDVHAHWDMPLGDVVKGTPFEKYASGSGLDERLPVMDKLGIDVAAVSVNDFWWYEAKDRGLARAICNAHNETLAKWVQAHPGRFVGMASVPLQFPDLAAEMLQDATSRLGARGVTIGGHVNNESVSSPRYDPFWSKAAELGQLVFMHPNGASNLIQPGALGGRGGMGNIVGNPLETTVFLSRLIVDGTFDKFPALRVCGAHGGGYLPSYLGRTEVGCQRPNTNCANTRRPSEYMRQHILADTMVFSEEGLRHLVAEMGVSQIVFGTDVPFNWPVTIDLILNASFLSDAEKEAILGGNLIKLLRITS